MDTSVTIVMFNRPKHLEEVLKAVARVQPKKLFVICDGPRDSVSDDIVKVGACRQLIDTCIKWNCEINKIYSDINLGCGKRLPTGLSEVFQHVDKTIILEDDCVPTDDFFRFCDEMLVRYENDNRIMSISGNNYFSHESDIDTYHFSAYPQTCGWATWRRVWNQYDYGIKKWPFFEKHLYHVFFNKQITNIWRQIFQDVYDKKIKTAWDYQFMFLSICNNGLNVIPDTNLIKNIGFDQYGTHTKDGNSPLANMMANVGSLKFPLRHPELVCSDYNRDKQDWVVWGYKSGFFNNLLYNIKSLLKGFYKGRNCYGRFDYN